jgi:hypothetical protein
MDSGLFVSGRVRSYPDRYTDRAIRKCIDPGYSQIMSNGYCIVFGRKCVCVIMAKYDRRREIALLKKGRVMSGMYCTPVVFNILFA